MGPRVFTLEEAEALIGSIEGYFSDLDAQREQLVQIKKKMDVLEMIHGSEVTTVPSPDAREYGHYLEQIDEIKKEFESICGKIAGTGAHLKGVDQGLVDFCGVIDGRLVELCWKRGEEKIEYYHHIGEGFGGRQPIPTPSEF